MSLLWVHVREKLEEVPCLLVQVYTMASINVSSCDYYIVDQIVYVFKDGRIIKLDRSRLPRWFEPLPPGLTRNQQIEETEDLVSHVLFEDGTWNVSG